VAKNKTLDGREQLYARVRLSVLTYIGHPVAALPLSYIEYYRRSFALVAIASAHEESPYLEKCPWVGGNVW
jgi:hypothetical protein